LKISVLDFLKLENENFFQKYYKKVGGSGFFYYLCKKFGFDRLKEQ